MISTIPVPPANAETINILHLEDSALDHQLVVRTLSKADWRFTICRVDSLADFQQALSIESYTLVLADYRLGDFTAIDAWNTHADHTSRIPFILLSGAIGEAAAVEAIQCGISDYLHKDAISALPRVIRRTLDLQNIKLAKEAADRELAMSEQRISELAGHLQSAIEEERASIAREVHDDIGGALAAIRLDLGWLARHSNDVEQLKHINAASEMVQHAAHASQRIMHNLRPAILDQGLVPSIQWLARSFMQRTSAKVEITTTSEHLELSPDVMLSAYRTAQEALTNASKYAAGSDVSIDISDLGGALTVEIRDRGPGIEKSSLQKQNSYGLRGLAERAKSVGGWLDISSVPDSGTAITLSIPLAERTPSTRNIIT